MASWGGGLVCMINCRPQVSYTKYIVDVSEYVSVSPWYRASMKHPTKINFLSFKQSKWCIHGLDRKYMLPNNYLLSMALMGTVLQISTCLIFYFRNLFEDQHPRIHDSQTCTSVQLHWFLKANIRISNFMNKTIVATFWKLSALISFVARRT